MKTRRAWRALIVGGLLFAAPSGAALGAPPGSDAATDKARELHQEGMALFKKGDYARARASFLAAWALKKHWTLAGNLGDSELKLGLHRDAAEHFAFFLREMSREKTPPPAAKALYEQARAKVGTAQVSASLPGADVLVDGKLIGTAPLADPVFVEPGRHVIEARLGGKVAWAAVDLAPGATQEVRLELAAPATAPAAAASAAPPAGAGAAPDDGAANVRPGAVVAPEGEAQEKAAVPVSEGPSPYVVLGGAVAGGAALAAGVVFTVLAVNKASEADGLLAKLKSDGPHCTSPPQPGDCATLLSQREDQGTYSNVALTMFVAGGVIGAATAAYALWPRPAQKPAVAVWGTPVALPGGGGVWIGGAF